MFSGRYMVSLIRMFILFMGKSFSVVFSVVLVVYFFRGTFFRVRFLIMVWSVFVCGAISSVFGLKLLMLFGLFC